MPLSELSPWAPVGLRLQGPPGGAAETGVLPSEVGPEEGPTRMIGQSGYMAAFCVLRVQAFYETYIFY